MMCLQQELESHMALHCLQHVGLPNSFLKDQWSVRIIHFLQTKPRHEVCKIAAKPLYVSLAYADGLSQEWMLHISEEHIRSLRAFWICEVHESKSQIAELALVMRHVHEIVSTWRQELFQDLDQGLCGKFRWQTPQHDGGRISIQLCRAVLLAIKGLQRFTHLCQCTAPIAVIAQLHHCACSLRAAADYQLFMKKQLGDQARRKLTKTHQPASDVHGVVEYTGISAEMPTTSQAEQIGRAHV